MTLKSVDEIYRGYYLKSEGSSPNVIQIRESRDGALLHTAISLLGAYSWVDGARREAYRVGRNHE